MGVRLALKLPTDWSALQQCCPEDGTQDPPGPCTWAHRPTAPTGAGGEIQGDGKPGCLEQALSTGDLFALQEQRHGEIVTLSSGHLQGLQAAQGPGKQTEGCPRGNGDSLRVDINFSIALLIHLSPETFPRLPPTTPTIQSTRSFHPSIQSANQPASHLLGSFRTGDDGLKQRLQLSGL